MLHATIDIDLPGQPLPTTGRVEKALRWLVGASTDPNVGRRKRDDADLIVLDRLLAGLRQAGFTDVVAISAGSRRIFVDEGPNTDDIDEALRQVVQSPHLRDHQPQLRVVASRTHDGLHSVVEVTVRSDAGNDQPDVQIRWSTRVADLRVGERDTPVAYRSRVVQALADGRLSRAFDDTTAALGELAAALQSQLPGSRVKVGELRSRVVAPGPTQVGRFRHLGFSARVRPRTYRPQPPERRTGAYDDPHVYHYYDPYHDLLSWILLQEARGGRWSGPPTAFVRPDGSLIFESTAVDPGAALPVPPAAVEFGNKRLVVADDLPRVGFDRAEAGSPHTPGFGGEGDG